MSMENRDFFQKKNFKNVLFAKNVIFCEIKKMLYITSFFLTLKSPILIHTSRPLNLRIRSPLKLNNV